MEGTVEKQSLTLLTAAEELWHRFIAEHLLREPFMVSWDAAEERNPLTTPPPSKSHRGSSTCCLPPHPLRALRAHTTTKAMCHMRFAGVMVSPRAATAEAGEGMGPDAQANVDGPELPSSYVYLHAIYPPQMHFIEFR